MRPKFGKLAAAAIATAGLLTAMAAPASASCTGGICIGGSSVSVSGGWLYVDGNSESNNATITWTGTNAYQVVDTTGADPGSGCSYPNPLDQTTVTCSGVTGNVVQATGGAGDDSTTVSASGKATDVYLAGGIAAFTSYPTDGNNTLTANVGGDVTLYGGGGADTLQNNSSTCNGCANWDWLNGGSGNDVVYGSAYRDEMLGAMYGDLHDYPGNDEYYGSGGADHIVDTMGVDFASGGAGNDEIEVKDSSGGDTANCGTGTDTVKRDTSDTWSNCETVS